MKNSNWRLVGNEILRDFRVVSVREHTYQFAPTGEQRGYVVCESADWVLVIAITPEQEVVFVRQFRHGFGEVVLEIPGGVMDPGETPLETAIRELEEETGYVPEQIEIFGPLLPNPAPEQRAVSCRGRDRLFAKSRAAPGAIRGNRNRAPPALRSFAHDFQR